VGFGGFIQQNKNKKTSKNTELLAVNLPPLKDKKWNAK